MLVCDFISMPNGEYSNLFIAFFFLASLFLIKHFLPVRFSYLLIFTDDKAEILAVCLSKSY